VALGAKDRLMSGRVWALVVKELLAVLRDRKSRAVLIVPPLMQLALFSFAATLDVKAVDLAVLDQDGGAAAVELAQRFTAAPYFASVRHLAGMAQVAPELENERAMAVLVLAQGFSRDVAAGRPATAQVLLDGRRSNTSQIVQGYIQAVVDGYNADLAARRGQVGPPARLVVRAWFNPNLDYLWFTVPNLIGMLTMVVGLIITALSVARERELGTFDQILVTPLSPREILAGKTIPAMFLGMTEGLLIVAAAILLFDIPFRGSFAVLLLAQFLFLLSVVGVGLFISSLCMTQQQAILGTFSFMIPAMLLSGFATPIETMPAFLQLVSQVNPLRYFLVAVRGVLLKGMSPGMVLEVVWPLVPIAVVTLSLASWFFRRRLG
jgi:ABC-2 type transport system permease protein